MSEMPSSCISKLNEETNEAEGKTSFVLQSQYGDMVCHFTAEEHRRRGLGRAVEIDLAKRIARFDHNKLFQFSASKSLR